MNRIPSPSSVSRLTIATVLAAVAAAVFVPTARADIVTDWNQRSAQLITESRLGTPPAVRVMAMVQTAAYEAAQSATQATPQMPHAVATDAAVAAAHRAVFLKLLPAPQHAAVEAAFTASIAHLPSDPAKAAGLALGERAAQKVLTERASDAIAPEDYRPHTTPGTYVPTVVPAVVTWGKRQPWLLARGDAIRPSAPPTLADRRWVQDFNEAKALGGRDSKQRSPEQTEVGRFWDYSLPAIYHGVVQSVAQQSGRSVLANARLFAAVAQGMDDAMIAVFDAKYAYNFWRPTTAIRNADQDGNDATERDARWLPLIDVPMHPEYPSGHSILASTVATVLEAEVGAAAMPVLSTTSPTASTKGVVRRWTRTEDFVREVSDARIWAGLHFRSATEAGEAMGRKIGKLAVERGPGAGQ